MRRRNRFRPMLEALEAREVPAVLQVNPAVATDFHTIQSAINAAQPGDTIDVAHASYQEDVIIDKSVSLIGQPDPVLHQNPFIVGAGGAGGLEAVVRVADQVNNVVIENFAIGNGEGEQQEQLGVLIGTGAGNVNLNHDVIRKVRNPLVAVAGPAVTDGILIEQGAHNVSISDLALYQIHDPTGSQGRAVGIVIDGANQVSINHTYVKNVDDLGILVRGSATGVGLLGIGVEAILSMSGIGIAIENSAQVALDHAKVYQLAGNSIGLLVEGSAQVNGTNCQLTENAYGVQVAPDFTGSLTLRHSNIDGNTKAGIDNFAMVAVNAPGDWWGDASGPAPHGLGNAVVGLVNVPSWLTTPAVKATGSIAAWISCPAATPAAMKIMGDWIVKHTSAIRRAMMGRPDEFPGSPRDRAA